MKFYIKAHTHWVWRSEGTDEFLGRWEDGSSRLVSGLKRIRRSAAPLSLDKCLVQTEVCWPLSNQV